jgi:hypothetical protein
MNRGPDAELTTATPAELAAASSAAIQVITRERLRPARLCLLDSYNAGRQYRMSDIRSCLDNLENGRTHRRGKGHRSVVRQSSSEPTAAAALRASTRWVWNRRGSWVVAAELTTGLFRTRGTHHVVEGSGIHAAQAHSVSRRWLGGIVRYHGMLRLGSRADGVRGRSPGCRLEHHGHPGLSVVPTSRG